jgi:hypothetical protein
VALERSLNSVYSPGIVSTSIVPPYDDVMAEGKTKARALASGLCREKGLNHCPSSADGNALHGCPL